MMKSKKGGLSGMLSATADDAKKKDVYSTTMKNEDPPKKKKRRGMGETAEESKKNIKSLSSSKIKKNIKD